METSETVVEIQRDEAYSAQFRKEVAALYPQLLAFAKNLHKGDQTKAEDLVSDLMIRAYECEAQFQPGTNLKAWLFMIQRNLFYSQMRRAWRQQEFPEGNPEFMPIEKMKVAASAEVVTELKEALKSLDYVYGDMKEAFSLIVFDELSYEEAAVVLGVEVGTVKSRVSRARRAVFQYLGINNKKEGNGDGSDATPRFEADE